MDSSPLFTVIIPCKNRAEYLLHTLKTCSSQDYEPLEVIVSDDGSTDHTREVVSDAMQRDHRIRFFCHDPGVGMRDNFEFALRQVRPGYVIALGGDDGLLPDGIRGMRDALLGSGLKLLAWPAPSFVFPNTRDSRGQLAFYREKGTKIIDSAEFLSRQAKTLHYLSDIESPMFYVKGVASTDIIDRVRGRSRHGRFYSCPTPDGYSGIVLAGEVEKFMFSAKPFAIHGLSRSSQGLAYLSNEEKAKQESELFFRSVSDTPMHADLALQPYSPLITLMTVDFLLTARDLDGWPGKVPMIDFRKMLSNGIHELAHGLYGEERLNREIRILSVIAEKHGLGAFFKDKLNRSKRHRKRGPFEGNGINRQQFFLDAEALGIGNIVDAAFSASLLYKVYASMSFLSGYRMIARSALYRWRSLGVGTAFPDESEWSKDLR